MISYKTLQKLVSEVKMNNFSYKPVSFLQSSLDRFFDSKNAENDESLENVGQVQNHIEGIRNRFIACLHYQQSNYLKQPGQTHGTKEF